MHHCNSPNICPWGSGLIPSLDGWRALSIVMVLGAHSTVGYGFPDSWQLAFKWFFDGNLAVRCFFIISGFLITTLLLRESWSHGRVNLKLFYIRRAVRILPVYFAFLIFVALLQQFTVFEFPLAQWLHLVTFTSNFSTYQNWLTGHTWSLASEEQFYLIWPVLFVFCGLQSIHRLTFILLFLTLIICPLWRVASYIELFPGNPVFGTYSLFNYLDSLAIGCLLAYVHPWLSQKLNRNRIMGLLILSGACLLIPYVLTRTNTYGIITIPLGPLLQAFSLATVISLSIHLPHNFFFSFLNISPVVWIGKLSYSIYIWQQFFCSAPTTFGWEPAWFQTYPFWLVAALLTSVASYYFLELPLINLRKRLREPRAVADASRATKVG